VRPRILNSEPENYSPKARRILQEFGDLVEEAVDQASLPEMISGYDALIVRLGLRVSKEVLEAGDRLKAVVTATTGTDHIDLDTARERGITVLCLRGEYEFLKTITATAEQTWGLLLALVRSVPWAFNDVLNGRWDRDRFRGQDLSGKRLGILGLGRIGSQVARYGLAFGMQTGAYDPVRHGWEDSVRRFANLEDLLRWSEVLCVHVPLNASTQGLLDEKRLRLLPAGAWLINTSRGAIIDETGLVRVLQDGHLAGAGLDVLSHEQPDFSRRQSTLLDYLGSENGPIERHL